MKNFFSIMFLFLILTLLVGCTNKQRARSFGGKEVINLPKGQKLVMITWKNDNIWYLTKPMLDSDKVETYEFQEESSFGRWEGVVVVIESK